MDRRLYLKQWKEKNKEQVKVKMAEYRKNHIEERKEYDKQYVETIRGKEVHRRARKKWRERNREHANQVSKEWYQKNKKRVAAYVRNRRNNNPKIKLKNAVSSLIRNRLRARLSNKGKKSISTFLPYTIDQLMVHLERLFQIGMSWKNYGEWHIDHIIPDSSFNYGSVEDEEFKNCWALKNLQPLWAIDNLQKYNKTTS